MERLIDKEGLISRIDYDESCKNSFFEAVDDWSRQLGNDLNVEKWNFAKGMGFALAVAYKNAVMPDKELRLSKQVYGVVAPLINFPLIPFFGMWAYRPKYRTIIRGNNLQRLAVCMIQGDLLIHEYLHVYEHNLHDYLLSQHVIKEQANPASIIEPNMLGFNFNPPPKRFLKKFEDKILRKLEKRGQILF